MQNLLFLLSDWGYTACKIMGCFLKYTPKSFLSDFKQNKCGVSSGGYNPSNFINDFLSSWPLWGVLPCASGTHRSFAVLVLDVIIWGFLDSYNQGVRMKPRNLLLYCKQNAEVAPWWDTAGGQERWRKMRRWCSLFERRKWRNSDDIRL